MEKVGMTFEGYHKESMFIKGEYRTVGVSAILRDEYFSKINNK
jgi:RimJ/RimL family protein N-acetyltransferase